MDRNINVYSVDLESALKQFQGAFTYYPARSKLDIFRFVSTEGVQWLSENINCGWLLTDIYKMSESYRKDKVSMLVTYQYIDDYEAMLDIRDMSGKRLFKKIYSFRKIGFSTNSRKISLKIIYSSKLDRHLLMLNHEEESLQNVLS